MENKNIGILGGTFNPVHNAHIFMAEESIRILKLDKLLIIPTYLPPHKSAEELASFEDRAEMCRLAFKDNPLIQVSEIEGAVKEKSYTYITLEKIKEQYPGARLFFIMGSDMFTTIQSWKEPLKVYKNAVLAVMLRDKDNPLDITKTRDKIAEHARVELLSLNPPPISSTEIRMRVRENSGTSGLIPVEVADYIGKNRLYKGIIC